jgi:uncharacterized protein (DUF305 family)
MESIMNAFSKILLGAIGALAIGFVAFQRMSEDEMASRNGVNNLPPSSKAFESAMGTMMTGMMTPFTGKADLDFVAGMMPHHQGAIDMAKVVLKFGKDPEIKKLAEGVVAAQEGEITLMKDWLAKTDQAALPVSEDSRTANEQAMITMMKDMTVPLTGDADVDFVKGMILHHQGAVDMAKAALQFAKDPAILKLASNVVSAQEGEMTVMKEWLKRKGM